MDSSDSNLRFLGIKALINLAKRNPSYATPHQMALLDCLESEDETLRREVTNSHQIFLLFADFRLTVSYDNAKERSICNS